MPSTSPLERIAALPKAELHLHLEGSIQPATLCHLAARHSVEVTQEEVLRRYAYQNFLEFLEVFKWVTSFVRDPQDYALITRDLGEQLLAQRVACRAVPVALVHEQDVGDRPRLALVVAGKELFHQRTARRR